jgi:hypothetical protein
MVRAAARAAMGKGSFADNFQAAVVGMGPMEAKLKDGRLFDEPSSPAIKEVQVKGLFPINRKFKLAFVISLFDETSGQLVPVISSLEIFHESKTLAYQHTNELGVVEPNLGLVGWVSIGAIIPDIVQTPYSGKRKLVAILRLIDLDNRPSISQGFHEKDHPGLLWQRTLSFEYVIEMKGYLEALELRHSARLLCVKVAMAIAMWDGSLDDAEGETIRRWVGKFLSGHSGEDRDRLKAEFNRAMKDAYGRSKSGDLSLTELTEKLNEIDDSAVKYETVELCFDILASSSIDSSDKARVIDLVANALNLDLKEIERITDLKIVGLSDKLSKEVRVEDLLGIDPRWDAQQIRRHLRAEFNKWNNRLSTLPEGDERNNAQRMLHAISEASRKYG